MVFRTFDIPEHCHREHPRDDIFSRKTDGKWKSFSTKEYLDYSIWIAMGFLNLGLKKGDKVATICSSNMPEWNFIDIGLARAGIIHVPVYPTISEDSFEYILGQADVSYIFISDTSIYKRLKPVLDRLPGLKGTFSCSPVKDVPCWKELISAGKENQKLLREKLKTIEGSIREEDTVTLIYTSGTTGNHKGVILTHRNLVSNLITASSIQPLGYKDKVLSFLPLSHIYERTSNYQFQYSGSSIYYSADISSIMNDLSELSPHGFTAVPRVLEKIRSYYISGGRKLKGFRKFIFKKSVELFNKYPHDHKARFSFRIKRFFLRLLVFRKVKKLLGGKIKFIGCGGARLAPGVEKFFWTAGLPVYQGYGLTETSPLISLNRSEEKYIGSVGPLIPGIELKISDNEEILVRGPNVTPGYYMEDRLTKETIDREGWFHTGDLGFFSNGFLFIEGRRKELFKTSYGKYIAPQSIESRFRESELINQFMVVGEGEKFAGALVIPDFDALFKRIKPIHKIQTTDRKKLIELPQVIREIENEINKINRSLDSCEQIKRFRIVNNDWSVISGELSPSMKLRRNFILKKYKDHIQSIYDA